MSNEGLISLDLNQLIEVIESLESVNVTLPLEQQEKINVMQEDLSILIELLTPVELTQDELLEFETLELNETEFNNSIESNLIDLNNNISYLTEVIETDINTYNEVDDLQTRSHGSNIILLYLVIFYMFVKAIFFIFNWLGTKF